MMSVFIISTEWMQIYLLYSASQSQFKHSLFYLCERSINYYIFSNRHINLFIVAYF